MFLSILPFFLLILNVQSQLLRTEESQEGLLGLCKPIACLPADCGVGFKELRKGCDCPVCIPDDKSQEHLALGRPTIKPNPESVCPSCQTQCAPGTRLVKDPTLCGNPRCVANGIPDEWEKPRPPNSKGLCLEKLDAPVECGNGTILVQDKSKCGCPRCVPINSSAESTECPPCRTQCAPGTRLVQNPTRCSNPRCVADGIPDEWEKPRPPGIVGLCFQPPDVPVDCGNGTVLVQDNSKCGCSKCVPIESGQCPPCKTECAAGTRLVDDPTRCHVSRCVADGKEDEWEKPRQPGIIGLCLQPPDGPAECGNGTILVQDKSRCGCPRCVPIESSECPACKTECAAGTRLVNDPTRCHVSRCVADGKEDEWEKPRQPGIIGLCLQPPDGPVQCGNGTILVQDKSRCGCPRCVPVESSQCPACKTECAAGTRLVDDPTRCHVSRCVADGKEDEWEKPRQPGILGLCQNPPDEPVKCGNGTILVQDRSRCGCPRCVPFNPSVESAQCPPCRTQCAPGTRLVQEPTRCHNPRCVADGSEDEWEKPRPEGLVGLCYQSPDVPVECGNGTRLVQDNSKCGCPRCVPINPSVESIQCAPCRTQCAPGTRLVQNPTRCSNPRCVANGIPDEWEKPRPPGIVGLCYQPPDVPVDCGNGTRLVQENSRCSCPRCVPINESEPCPGCKVQCAAGTRLVQDPTRCHNPRCVADGIPDEWEKPRPPGIVGLCFQPPDVPVECGNGTVLVQDKSRCGCGRCVPVPCQVQCGAGTVLVKDPRRCNPPQCLSVAEAEKIPKDDNLDAPGLCYQPPDVQVECGKGTKKVPQEGNCNCHKCVPITESSHSESLFPSSVHCKHKACPQVLCRIGTRRVTDPTGCSCPKCVPLCSDPLPPLPPLPVPCKPEICPQVLCDSNSTLLEDPEGCKCSICHSPSAVSNFSTESLLEGISCKFICPAIKCPAGQSPQRDHRFVCSCPTCQPDHPIIPKPIGPICDIACPFVSCRPDQRLVRFPGLCSCPRCVPRFPTVCKPTVCPAVACAEDSFLVEDPLGCRCPVCRPRSLLQAAQSIRDKIQCNFICPKVKCPEGQSPQRDHRYVCSCPKCQPNENPTTPSVTDIIVCDFACLQRQCPAGQELVRDPSVKCGCPKCRQVSCKPLPCPQVLCEKGAIRIEDPAGCRCPVCYGPSTEVSPESLKNSHVLCLYVCKPLTCPPGTSPKRDHRYVCGCPKCVADNDTSALSPLGPAFEFACPACPAGSFPYRDPGVKVGCPVCIPINNNKTSTVRGGSGY